MPAYGMQGAALRAGAEEGGDDDEGDNASDVGSSYSAYSSASAVGTFIGKKAQKKGNFNYMSLVQTSRAQHQQKHTQSSGHAHQQATSIPVHKDKGKGKKNKKGKKVPAAPTEPKTFNVLIPASNGWETVQLSKENAQARRNQAIANVKAKGEMIWVDLLTQQFMQKVDNKYNPSANVITSITNLTSGFDSYDTAIRKLWGFQCELKKSHREKYIREPDSLPYDTKMEFYATDDIYNKRMKALGMTQKQFNTYNKTKLIVYFVKSLMSYQSDKYTMPTETQIAELKKTDKNTSKIHLMRKDPSNPYNELHSMADALIPWMQIINKSVELETSKERGHANRPSFPTKYGGVLQITPPPASQSANGNVFTEVPID